jgi:hypothetical protein
VVEVRDPTTPVNQLSLRDLNVAHIVRTSEKLNVGITEHCAYRRALAEAEELLRTLSAEGGYHARHARRGARLHRTLAAGQNRRVGSVRL